MPVMVKVGNSGEFAFSTEQDAEAAKALVQNCVQEVRNEADQMVQAAHAESAEHLGKFAEAQEALKKLQALVDSLSSEETQEQNAEALATAKGDQEAIMGQPDLPDKDKLQAAVGNCKTMRERKAAIVAHVLNARGISAEGMKPEQVDTAWSMLAVQAKTANAKPVAGTLPVPGAQRTQNAGAERKHPIFPR